MRHTDILGKEWFLSNLYGCRIIPWERGLENWSKNEKKVKPNTKLIIKLILCMHVNEYWVLCGSVDIENIGMDEKDEKKTHSEDKWFIIKPSGVIIKWMMP